MKLNASRKNRDEEDIAFLLEQLKFDTLDQVTYFFESRSPGETLSPKALALVSGLLDKQ
mgnify:CR=1 FL=1